MERLRKYFTGARTCVPDERKIGLEVETLFVDKTEQPITLGTSQRLLRGLAEEGWKVEQRNGLAVVARDGEWLTCYELGHNNIELVTPVFAVSDRDQLLDETQARLNQLYRCGGESAKALPYWHDGAAQVDTLIMPDTRDEIWSELDGPVLRVLGHIASVHINIDLVSLDEGFAFIRQLNQLYRDRCWPPADVRSVWDRYINESRVRYESDRYGPPPETFDAYIDAMAGYSVVMNRIDDELRIVAQRRSFAEMDSADQDLFMRSIWWWSRLRVRSGQLVLEIRAVPRGSDAAIVQDVTTALQTLNLI